MSVCAEDKLAIPVLKGERAHREAVIALEWVTDPIHQVTPKP